MGLGLSLNLLPMLTELRISNFAVIDQVSPRFSVGFNVLTGETGAGKSILVEAVALLVGGRASADQIRSDADEAVLEAAFSIPPTGPLAERLRESGVLGPSDTELIIRRVLSRGGRNRIYLNGNLTPLHAIQSLAGTLVDIHGQHEQQSLLSMAAQLDALDAFGHLRDLRGRYAEQYEQWRARLREMEQAARLADERRQREELLRFQYQELQDARLCPGEEESLTAERQRLAHVRRLRELAEEAYELLYGADTSVLGHLGVVGDRLRALSEIDTGVAELAARCEGVRVELRELAHRLRDYRQGLDEDPGRLAEIEERLDRLRRLMKKYGGNVESLIARVQELSKQLDEMARSESRAADLQALVSEDLARVEALADELSESRRRAASRMEKRVREELGALKMDRTRFQIQVSTERETSALGPTGRDRVEYLLSANPGEPLHPLARVASGGELSRVMLAIKTVLAETDRVPVLIFDEIDAGIGGAVAAVMGQRLRALGDFHQVFCITHLPQIASQAGTHFLVEKRIVKKRTVTRVKLLDQEERREEIARMLAGLAITRAVRETAAEMIGEAERER